MTETAETTERHVCKGDDTVSPTISLRRIETPAGAREYSTAEGGLTKREYFAVMAMQAVAQNNTYLSAVVESYPSILGTPTKDVVAVHSVAFADALIDALNQEAKSCDQL